MTECARVATVFFKVCVQLLKALLFMFRAQTSVGNACVK